MRILLLQAGGTIDKGYPMGDDHHGYGFEIVDPAFDRVIRRVSPSSKFSAKSVIKKDSLDMTDEDRGKLLHEVEDARSERIIITHGTDTMIKTAAVLSNVQYKTVVLTGAMTPERFKDSDADFNLGFAIAAVKLLPHGVYIAMNGEVFAWDEVGFDTKKSRFVGL